MPTESDRRAQNPLRQRVSASIRHAVGLTQEPPPRCDDPDESYFALDSVARVVHGDLASMLIGGLGSLFFQMLHPHAMAGVAQHSRYQRDPLGRLLQTANFIGDTTYGSRARAYHAIEKVLAVHEGVRGVADDGIAYRANDPHLLAWVHAAEISMFLRAYQRFGRYTITGDEADQYVAEMATLARDMGVVDPPTNVAQLEFTILHFAPELRLSDDGAIARDFVARGVVSGRLQRLAYWLLVQSSFDLMADRYRQILGVPRRRWRDRFIIMPAAWLLCRVLRVFVPPPPRFNGRG
ncbi:MAG: DUF2236 domain-containing protein [Acidimicrobiaceae bacterium]|nr:DUF2236 domain-containing protein [Acidimicrobiaceae bacterium]